MFGKTKRFYDVEYNGDLFEQTFLKFSQLLDSNGLKLESTRCRYYEETGNVHVANPDGTYRKTCFSKNDFSFYANGSSLARLGFLYFGGDLLAEFEGLPTLHEAEALMFDFNRLYRQSKLSESRALRNVDVFVGHGRSRLWRDLKDHLHDHHGLKITAYETGARAGYTIQEVLTEMSDRASLALLVHTGEDIDRDGVSHARENVVHETGLFQGKLGMKRAIVLLEEGTNEFSNIAGLQQIRFQKGNIKETFGDVLAIIRREFIER